MAEDSITGGMHRSAVGLALAAACILVTLISAVGVIGAIIARLQPYGMTRALFATALAQALVAVIALIAGKHQSPVSSVAEILILNGCFVALFLGSARLFQNAAREQRKD